MSNFKVNPQVTPETHVIKRGEDLLAVGGRYTDSKVITISGVGTSGTVEDWYMYSPQAAVDFDGQSLTNLPSPLTDNEAATKFYVDDLVSSLEISSYDTVFGKIEGLRTAVPDIVLTTTGVNDLNIAISGLTDGQVLEIQTSAVYDPITIPSGVAFSVKVAEGYAPSISGQECIRIEDGATDVILSSLIVEGCTTSYQNGKGSAITFSSNHAKADNLIFHNITIRNAQGSAILLAYYNSGDYATAPTLSQMSTNISFVGCHLHKATTDKIEGGAVCLRGTNNALIYDCYVDSANLGRGMHLQNSINMRVENCYINNCDDGNGGEGIKLDQLGTISGYRNSAIIINNTVKRCIEGIDLDDVTSVNIVQNNIVSECSGECISVDGGSFPSTGIATLVGNTCYNSNTGIRVESGAVSVLKKNVCYNNTTDYLIQNGYSLDDSNTTSLDDTFIATFASTTKNDSTVSGATVEDALETLATPAQGITGDRPGSPNIGEFYFDTTLGIPIWYDGSNWITASGTTV
jgi:hypothetical protein